MQRKKPESFENIDQMSHEFDERVTEVLEPGLASYWQLRILLAIAQQLSVISASLKEREEK
jgi:hypothetical protein